MGLALGPFGGLGDGGVVAAAGDLVDLGEAHLLEGGVELAGLGGEEAVDGRGDEGDDLLALGDGVDHVGDLVALHDGREGAGLDALAAADALLVVDGDAAVVGLADGAHGAGVGAGQGHLDDGVVTADLGALAAVDAEVVGDRRAAVAHLNGVAGADVRAGARQAAAAHVRHHDLRFHARRAGVREDGEEGVGGRRVGLGVLGVALERLQLVGLVLHAEAEGGHATVAERGAVLVDAAAREGLAFGADLDGDAVDVLVLPLLDGLDDVGQHLAAQAIGFADHRDCHVGVLLLIRPMPCGWP